MHTQVPAYELPEARVWTDVQRTLLDDNKEDPKRMELLMRREIKMEGKLHGQHNLIPQQTWIIITAALFSSTLL